jgi:hypothetical protein
MLTGAFPEFGAVLPEVHERGNHKMVCALAVNPEDGPWT